MDLGTRPGFTFGPLAESPGREAFPPSQDAILLVRRAVDPEGPWSGVKGEEFALASTITYDVARVMSFRHGSRRVRARVSIRVPAGAEPMPTDLTSVPALFTWLVPKSGAHLPAALVHDGLYCDDEDRTYLATARPVDGGEPFPVEIDRVVADEIFREAMGVTGVGVIRRWLVWAAVTTGSLVTSPRPPVRWPWWCRAYYVAVVALTVLAILWLGYAATLDLFDVAVDGTARGWVAATTGVPLVGGLVGDLPWMPEAGFWVEVLWGAAGAVVVPAPLAALWLRYWRAGAVTAVALASLVHVTVVLLLTALYQAADLAATRWPRLGAAAGGALVLVALAAFVAALLTTG